MNQDRSVKTQEVLESGVWYRSLPDDLKAQLMELAVEQNYEPSMPLFRRGDERSGIYAVIEGMVRVSGLNEQGKEAILTFVEPSNWMGEVALFDGEVRTHDAFAETHVRVLYFSQQGLDDILCRKPLYWREFGLLIAHKLRLAFIALEDLSLLPAPARLARRLVLMAEGYGEKGAAKRSSLPVPQEQLGMMLSISRQTTNQILKDLQSKGLIDLTYGQVEIVDMAGLKRVCGMSTK